jgi:hypothetical protein
VAATRTKGAVLAFVAVAAFSGPQWSVSDAEAVVSRPSAPSGRTVASTTGFAQGHTILWVSDDQLARDLDGMVRAGAGWLRLDFDWPSIQSGGRDRWNWGPTDRVVAAASARGLSILAVPAYTPDWARPAGTSGHHPPTDPADYARFVGVAAERYAPRGVHHWEIWNEPNLDDFWQPAPDPVAYTELLVAASAAIHGVDRTATVMNGGLAPASDIFGDALAPRSFLMMMYAAGAGPAIDAVAMHPYSFPYAPMLRADWNAFSTLPQTHALMARFGDGRKPIWATESGFGTGSDEHSVNESVQALRMRQLVDAWYEFDFTGNLFLYTYRDLSATSPMAFERMGLVRADGSPKPAFRVFQQAIEQPAFERDVQRGMCGPAAHLAPAGNDHCVETRRVARFVRARVLAAMGS